MGSGLGARRRIMQRRDFLTITGLAAASLTLSDRSRADEDRPVSITVHADKPQGDFQPTWRCFGADEPNYAYRKDGKKLLGELGKLGTQQVYFRTHNLLTSGDGTPA